MKVRRGRTVALLFASLGLLVLLVFGRLVVQKRDPVFPARGSATPGPAPPPAAGSPRVRLGISVAESDEGLSILNVRRGSSAEKGGLRPGDLLRSVAGYSVNQLDGLLRAVSALKPDFPIPVLVNRNGKEIELRVTPEAFRTPEQSSSPRPGLKRRFRNWRGEDLGRRP